MPTTFEEAYVTITGEFETAWAANAPAVVSPAPEIRYAGNEKTEIPKTYFARFSMQPVIERQASFRDGETRRYTSEGLIFIQVFAPRSDKQAFQNCRALATVGKLAFRGKTFDGCIWFYNVRINDIPPEASFLRLNVVAEYTYDEMG